MSLYLLSIVDNLGMAGTILAVTCLMGFVFCTVGANCERDEKLAKCLGKLARRFGFLAIVGFLICTFVPSKKALREAYIMREASNIATSENVEKAIHWADQKIDKMIEKQNAQR